jgi:protein disulfide-isomerase A6
MLLPHLHLLALTLALVPSFVSAAMYPKDSLVKMIDARGFKNALKDNVCVSTKLGCGTFLSIR